MSTVLSDLLVKQVATLHPEILGIEDPGIQKAIAFALIAGTAVDPEHPITFEQAKMEALGMYETSTNAAKLLSEEKARRQRETITNFTSLVAPIVEEQALAISDNMRPIALRIVVTYNANKESADGTAEKDSEGNLVTVPVLVKVEPIWTIKKIGSGTGTSTGSGRTVGIFKVKDGDNEPVKLGDLSKLENQPTTGDKAKLTPRAYLESIGYTIATDADSNGIKWIVKPALTPAK